ncbi:MAG: tetratricopeptide repeat protein [Candidatus Omnitrophota bacterium]|jgi:tetratricopeptide (TPR) repeat protein
MKITEKTKIPVYQKFLLIFFGILLSFVILESVLYLCGVLFLSVQERRNLISIRQQGAYRILCMGESTTANGGHVSYPAQLETILNSYSPGIKFSVINKGVPGTSTKLILEQIESYLDKYHPNMVITMMGINDQDHECNQALARLKTPKCTFIDNLKIVKSARLLAKRIRSSFMKGRCDISNNIINLNQWDPLLIKDLRSNSNDFSARSANGEGAIENKVNSVLVDKYVKLADSYLSRGKYKELEAVYRKLIKLDPQNYSFHVNLGWSLIILEKFDQAALTQENAIKIRPGDETAYNVLGFIYLNQKKYAQAERMFLKVIEINPKNNKAYVDLGQCYLYQKKYRQAAEIYAKGIAENPRHDRVYGGLAMIHISLGNLLKASRYFKEANEVREKFYLATTVANYRKLAEILRKNSVKYICMQYPMRSVISLKNILAEYPEIVFVDNEKIFKDSVEKEGYAKYFTDLFAGDFGHCTPQGNRLLAGNLATVISREIWR